jgi:hypothetical protein
MNRQEGKYELANPYYVDPMYRQYEPDRNRPNNRFPNVIKTPYPIVDPHRLNMGKGLSFRSKYDICPDGWTKGENRMCHEAPTVTTLIYPRPAQLQENYPLRPYNKD